MAILVKDFLERWIGAKEPNARSSRRMTFIGEFTYRDLSTGANATELYAWHGGAVPRGTMGFTPAPVIVAPNAPPRLVLPALSLSLVESEGQPEGDFAGGPEFRSASGSEIAEVRLLNEDGALDAVLDHGRRSYAGRTFGLYVLGDRTEWPAPGNVLYEMMIKTEPTFDTETGEIIFELRASSLFDPDAPLHRQANLYFSGGGGAGGKSDLRGREKPLVYGQFAGHWPTPLDSTLLTYLVHGGGEAINAIAAVYEGGLKLTLTTDYTIDLDAATITLVNSPTGPITCDGTGAKFDSGAYSANAGKIARELLVRHGGVAVTRVTLGTYSTDFPQTAGLVIPWGEETILRDALERILRPRGFWLQEFGKTPRVALKAMILPTSATAALSYRSIDVEAITQQPLSRPASQVRVRYGAILRPLGDGDYVGAVSLAERLRQSREWRETTWPPTPLADGIANAVPITVDTPWVNPADADAEALVQLDRWRTPRRLMNVKTGRKILHSELGDVVSVTYADGDGRIRFGLDQGGRLLQEDGTALLTEPVPLLNPVTGDPLLNPVTGEPLITDGTPLTLEGADGATLVQVVGVRADWESQSFGLVVVA